MTLRTLATRVGCFPVFQYSSMIKQWLYSLFIGVSKSFIDQEDSSFQRLSVQPLIFFSNFRLFSADNRRIRAGTSNRNSGGTVIGVQSRINHPSYGSQGMDADIALVRLLSTLTYSNSIQPIPIPPQGFELTDNLPVVHSGWGTTTVSFWLIFSWLINGSVHLWT